MPDKFQNHIKSQYYIRPKADSLTFTLKHYAGSVVYDAVNFLEKNRDFLPPEIVQLLRQSTNEVVRFLFQCPLTKTGNLSATSTYGTANPPTRIPHKLNFEPNLLNQVADHSVSYFF